MEWACPPAWIAKVRDRTKFLIDGAGAEAGAKGVSKAKAAPKKFRHLDRGGEDRQRSDARLAGLPPRTAKKRWRAPERVAPGRGGVGLLGESDRFAGESLRLGVLASVRAHERRDLAPERLCRHVLLVAEVASLQGELLGFLVPSERAQRARWSPADPAASRPRSATAVDSCLTAP